MQEIACLMPTPLSIPHFARAVLARETLSCDESAVDLSLCFEIADQTRRCASLLGSGEAAPLGIQEDIYALMEKVRSSYPGLWSTAFDISADDPAATSKTLWQMIFASVESTAITIEGALVEYLRGSRTRDAVQLVWHALLVTPATRKIVLEPLEDLDVCGITLPKNAKVVLDIAVANESLPEGERRRRQGGYSFGSGERLCPGRQVAIAEAVACVRFLLDTYEIEIEDAVFEDRFFYTLTSKSHLWPSIIGNPKNLTANRTEV